MDKNRCTALIAAGLLGICICVIIIVNIFNGGSDNYETYQINIETNCVYNDSVGNEWTKIFIMDGKEISSGHIITVQSGKVCTKTIKAIITEYDEYPDIGSWDVEILIRDNEEITKSVFVCEADGMNKGGIAEWEVKISAKKV